MNLPNKLTLLRIIMTPFFVACLLAGWNIAALALFCLASVTDFVDGYIARKYHLITDLGKFLDPLADKILTTCGLICFVELGFAPAFLVCIITAREFFVSGIRLAAAGGGGSANREKKVIAADLPGKIKTFVTMTAVIVIICLQIFGVYASFKIVGDILLYVSAVLTVWSGAEIFIKHRFVFK